VQRIEAREDWENGFFYYSYRVTVFKARPMPDGSVYEQIIAECEGSANSKERRYRNQDVYTIVNTLQKMAIKRALVGATLQATGTSGMFTQDVEDMDLGESVQRQEDKPQGTSGKAISDKQMKAVFAAGKDKGLSSDDIALFAKIKYRVAHLSELTSAQASELIDGLNKTDAEKLQTAIQAIRAKIQAEEGDSEE